MPTGGALGQPPPPTPAWGRAQLPAGWACLGPRVGGRLSPPRPLPRGLFGVTCHAVSGAEAWLWPWAGSEGWQVRVPRQWLGVPGTCSSGLPVHLCLFPDCGQPWEGWAEHGACSLGLVVCGWVGGVEGGEGQGQGRASLVRTDEGQTGTRPEGGWRQPTCNRTLLPKGSLGGQPSRIPSQAQAGQAEPGATAGDVGEGDVKEQWREEWVDRAR